MDRTAYQKEASARLQRLEGEIVRLADHFTQSKTACDSGIESAAGDIIVKKKAAQAKLEALVNVPPDAFAARREELEAAFSEIEGHLRKALDRCRYQTVS